MKFYRNQEIEELAESRLHELEQLLGKPLAPPIPIDLVAEKVLGLRFLWEPIEELPGTATLGGLIPKSRLIILNESHRQLFGEKPGLERSTKGHEMGHWDLFVDKASLVHPTLFGEECANAFAQRRSRLGDVVIIKRLQLDTSRWELLRQLKAGEDEPDVARSVNRYAVAISMPQEMVREKALRTNRTEWPNLYRLAEEFGVTITALRVRLEQLGLLYVDKDGMLYVSPQDAKGQRTLGF